MQLLTDLERATVTGYGEKKTDVNKEIPGIGAVLQEKKR